MSAAADSYGLDMHCTMILEDYRAQLPLFEKMKEIVTAAISGCIAGHGIYVTAVESRVKKEESLARKLDVKGAKYASLEDITDIVGVRVITFYSDEVDKISALAERLFDVDWANSVDKRKMLDPHSFGYSSLHFICRIPETLYRDPEHPEINRWRFELQMRTALQHVWSTLDHDTGYKSGIEVPREYLRSLNRLAGVLELADEQFCVIRSNINNYRRKVQALVQDGKFDEVELDGDTFRSYLELAPFDKLLRRIASINQAEIHRTPLMPYLKALLSLGFKTLGDVEKLKSGYEDDAFQLSLAQLTGTDLDIVSSTIALQNLLVVYVIGNGGGETGLKSLFDTVQGPSERNRDRARRIMETAAHLSFMNK